MTPEGNKPTQYKPYYDFFTWLVTQLAFSFTTAPFILLSVHSSMLAWARVYFYCIIGVTICSVFLVTPGKTYLQKKVKARTATAKKAEDSLPRTESQENMQGATLGVPYEPGQEFDEMVDEIMEEVKKRKGSGVGPDGMALRKRVENALHQKVDEDRGKKQ